jgi:hypothetical protein
MTAPELQRWGREYDRNLRHKIALQRIRDDGRNFTATMAALRRREEQLSLRLLRDRVKWAHEDAARGRKAFPLDLAERWQAQQSEIAGVTRPDEVPFVAAWNKWAVDSARDLGVEILWTATPGVNAYAWQKLMRIEVAPIRSAASCATAGHEFGHCACPCQPSHIRVETDKELKRTCCPECEINAWRWAIEHIRPTWTRRMHDCLARSLATYRRYAADGSTIARQMDEVISPMAYFNARQRRATQMDSR